MDLALTLEDGTVTRVAKAKRVATYVPPPLLDVADFGAVADNPAAMAANVEAFARAFSQARLSGAHVIARKIYWLNKTIRQDSITFHNEGALWFDDGTTQVNAGLLLSGNAPKLNLTGSINSTATVRGGGAWGQHCVTVGGAVDFEIYGGGLVQGAACVGVFLQNAKRGLIRGIRARNTKADNFHNTYGTEFVTWEDCAAEGGGDDMMAVVSYGKDGRAADGTGGVICRDITVRRFRGTNNKWGRGLSVVGGERITFEDSTVSNVNGFGIYLASEGNTYNTRGVRNVTLRRVAVNVCGLYGLDLGDGLRVFGRSGLCSMGLPQTVEGVLLDGVTVTQPRRFAALVNTTYSKDIQRAGFTSTAPWRELA